MQLSGKVAIVTGAASGIGRATARSLAARGVVVVATDRREGDLATLRHEIDVSTYACDVRNPSHGDDLVKHALDRHGRLDIVVANAGIGHSGPVAEMTPQRIIDLVEINVRAPMLLVRAALPTLLRQESGAIVLVSSIAGEVLVPRETVYSATKAAVEAFAEPLREELRGSGVTVSTVAPGVVATRFFDGRGEPYDRRFPRPLDPAVLARAIVHAIETGRAHQVVPRWLGIAPRVRAIAPRSYRAIARRFG